MKILKKTVLALLVATAAFSCTVYQSHDITGNAIGTKVGVSKSAPFQKDADASVMAAAKNGKISKIGSVDVTIKVFIFPFMKTVVTGE